MVNIRKLEKELWEAADLLRANSKVTSQEYCMPVLGLIFLRYAYSRFKFVETEILKDRPIRNGRVLPVEAADFKTKSAIFLPEEARYEYLLNLPDNTDMGQAINKAMELIEEQSSQLKGILPKNYNILKNDLLCELLRIFNNSAFNEIQDDIIGRIYEYFLNKFAPVVASDDGVFFTPKSLVQMIVNVIEPNHGTVLDPACGSGGMFVASADFIEQFGANANTAMTFFGQEKLEYNAKLCVMNMAVHGLNAKIISGDEANSFYHDAHNLEGTCDYVMANPPFNVDKVNSETASNAGRLPFGMPSVNKNKEIGNANYLWISYFHAYLNETGRAGFVMASSATDSQGKDKDIREQLIRTGDVDVMLSVGNNFFYTKSLPCTLWFFDKAKRKENKDKILFIDARNYYTAVDRTLNEWSEWQMKNLNAIVWLYRGEVDKYQALLNEYFRKISELLVEFNSVFADIYDSKDSIYTDLIKKVDAFSDKALHFEKLQDSFDIKPLVDDIYQEWKNTVVKIVDDVTLFERINQYYILKKRGYKNAKDYKKRITESIENAQIRTNKILNIIDEAQWLYEKFGDGEYTDILGLCKTAYTTKEAQADDENGVNTEEKGFSLTPGAYVGVKPVEDDGVDFATRMAEIHKELLALQTESNELMKTISMNMKEMGL